MIHLDFKKCEVSREKWWGNVAANKKGMRFLFPVPPPAHLVCGGDGVRMTLHQLLERHSLHVEFAGDLRMTGHL